MRSLPFLIVLIAGAFVASWIDRGAGAFDGFLFNAVVAAEFALLGVLLALVDAPITQRLRVVILGSVGIGFVSILRPFFNGWELLFAVMRLVVLAAVFAFIRVSRGLVLSNRDPSARVDWKALSLRHLFLFTAVVALFLSFVRLLKNYDGAGGDIFLVILTVLIGAFAGLVPVVAAIGALGQRSASGAVPYGVAVLLLATCMGAFAYSQTDNVNTGLRWSIGSVAEGLIIAGAILVARRRGYELVSDRLAVTTGAVGPPEAHEAVFGGSDLDSLFPPPGEPSDEE